MMRLVLFFYMFLPVLVMAKTDSIATKSFSYYRIGIDLFKPITGLFQQGNSSYEMQLDVYYSKSINLVTELGFGTAKTNNDYLNYSSNNTFLRLGVDHPFFTPDFLGDKDNAFIGLRYALSRVHRNPASITIYDPLWGPASSSIGSQNFMAHWIELTGGFRLEVKKNIFLGWNMRMKSLINPNSVQKFPPPYLAGYGRGDRNTQVDFNLYLLYGLGKR